MRNTNKKNNTDPLAEVAKHKKFKEYSEESDLRIALAVEIFNAREKLKLSQQELAKNVGTTQRIISNIENGYLNIGTDLLNRLVKFLNLKSDNLARIFNCGVLAQFLQVETKTPQTVQSNSQLENQVDFISKQSMIL